MLLSGCQHILHIDHAANAELMIIIIAMHSLPLEGWRGLDMRVCR